MTHRTAVFTALISMAILAVLAAGAAAARVDEPGGTEYLGVALERSGLSLSDDTPLSQMEPEPGYGGRSGGGPEQKNPMVAFLLSCVLPGWGEIYAGETTRGRWFMAAEAGIWTGYAAFEIQAGMRTDDYEEYAQIFADASSDASDGYLSDIGDFIRSEGASSYNESIRREARSLYPDDLEAQAAYLAEHGYFGDESWDWGTRERFLEYRELRREASRSERKAFYMTGLALLNRALSAVDSAWMARRHNAGLSGEPTARLSVTPEFDGSEVGARATLEVSF